MAEKRNCGCADVHVLYTPSRTLRSASDALSLQIPRTRLSAVGSRAFSVFCPSTWGDLPLPLRQKPSLDSFKCNLKTFLFPKLQACHGFCSVLLSSSTCPFCRVNSASISQNARVRVRVCACMPVCVCLCVCMCVCVHVCT